jgi:cytochrome c
MNTIACCRRMLACGLLLASAVAGAADTADLLRQKRCHACHEADKALIGPPWKAIALRYQASRQQSIDVLARKIVSGGGGAWGVVPMVPNEHVSMAEARAMAEWILDQAAR